MAERAPRPLVNLALQGGGAHGAFTWGVLDFLLEDGRLGFDGLSGTSAGAMNAALTVQGLVEGGAAAARAKLATFWGRIAEAFERSPLRPNPIERFLFGHDLTFTAGYLALDALTRTLAPAQFNPLDLNPLRDILEDLIDLEALHGCTQYRLFVSATNVRTGRNRVFTEKEVTIPALLASACLPHLYRAVEIDGEAYWDGGYMGNPALWPMFYRCTAPDLVVVEINPIHRPEVPDTAPEIINRVNEISFNTALMAEMRAIAFVQRLLDQGAVDPARYKRLFVHSIHAEEAMARFNVSTKFNGDAAFLAELKALGRAAARAWLATAFDKIGRASSVDLRARYL
ncbi:patatin-like phospholipase family protein [Elioraea sp.]|uniref:patatin-like phospholipase family protein n=1 Tax=Elioraea sp. TaxID=2185103 RepID=UPI00307E0E42